MRTIRVPVIAFAAIVLLRAAQAADVSYVAFDAKSHGAILRDDAGNTRRVAKGQTFADLGELRQADEQEAVFERRLGEEEREALKAAGLVAPDVRRVRIPLTAGQSAPAMGALDPPR